MSGLLQLLKSRGSITSHHITNISGSDPFHALYEDTIRAKTQNIDFTIHVIPVKLRIIKTTIKNNTYIGLFRPIIVQHS